MTLLSVILANLKMNVLVHIHTHTFTYTFLSVQYNDLMPKFTSAFKTIA